MGTAQAIRSQERAKARAAEFRHRERSEEKGRQILQGVNQPFSMVIKWWINGTIIGNVMGINMGYSGDVRLIVNGDAMGHVSKYFWDLGVVWYLKNGVYNYYSIYPIQGFPCPFWHIFGQ